MKKLILLLSLLALVACPDTTPSRDAAPLALDASAPTEATASATPSPAPRRTPAPDTRPTPRATPTTAFAHFAGQSTFEFKPGGTAGGTIYTDWPSTAQAIKLSPPPRWLYVDDTLAPAHMIAGGPYDLDQTIFLGNQASSTFTLHIDTGATFTSSSITVGNGLLIQNDAVGTSPWTPSTFWFLKTQDLASIKSSSGAAAFVHVTAAGSFGQIQVEPNTVLGNGTVNVVSVDTGQTVEVLVAGPQNGTGIFNNAFGGLGSCIVTYDDGAEPGVSLTQTISTFSRVYIGSSNSVGQTTALGAGTASPATFTPTTHVLQKRTSGSVRVSAGFSGTASAAGLVTLVLNRDATPIAEGVFQVKTNGDGFSISASVLDTLPDFAGHSYAWTMTNGAAGTFTGTTSGTYLWANEEN